MFKRRNLILWFQDTAAGYSWQLLTASKCPRIGLSPSLRLSDWAGGNVMAMSWQAQSCADMASGQQQLIASWLEQPTTRNEVGRHKPRFQELPSAIRCNIFLQNHKKTTKWTFYLNAYLKEPFAKLKV